MISLHRSMHSSQMYTPGPAMSFLTCFCDLPQKEHFSRSPPSPMRATYDPFAPGTGAVARPVHSPTVPPWPPRVPPFRGASWAITRSAARDTPSLGGRRGDTRPASAGPDGHPERADLAGGDDLVDDAVVLRFGRGEDGVALDVGADLVLRLPGVPGQHVLQ